MCLLNYNNIDLTFLSQSLRAVTAAVTEEVLADITRCLSQSWDPAVQAISFKIFLLFFL